MISFIELVAGGLRALSHGLWLVYRAEIVESAASSAVCEAKKLMPLTDDRELSVWVRRIFVAAGVPPEVAHRVAESLVESNLVGHDSHGVIRVPQYLEMVNDGRINPRAEPRVAHETSSTAVVDGGWQFGQVAARFAMEVALAKASQSGVAAVQLHQSGHIGRLGEYAAQALAKGMVGLVTTNNHGGGQVLSPFGGVARRLSPSPIAIAVPGGPDFPIVLDMTTSVAAEGKVRVKRARGEKLPEGWILDAQGRPSNDPAAFYGPPPGSLTPLGGAAGYKGCGLAFMIDVLSGALGGAGCSRPDPPPLRGNGAYLQAIDPAAFGARDRFPNEVAGLVEYVKSSPLAPGFDRIRVPGEVEHEAMVERHRHGIDIEDETWQKLQAAAAELGLK